MKKNLFQGRIKNLDLGRKPKERWSKDLAKISILRNRQKCKRIWSNSNGKNWL